MISKERFEANSDASKKEGFRRWMQDPMARALISTLPPSENLEVILQAAYETGFSHGTGAMAVEFLQHIMAPDKRGPR